MDRIGRMAELPTSNIRLPTSRQSSSALSDSSHSSYRSYPSYIPRRLKPTAEEAQSRPPPTPDVAPAACRQRTRPSEQAQPSHWSNSRLGFETPGYKQTESRLKQAPTAVRRVFRGRAKLLLSR